MLNSKAIKETPKRIMMSSCGCSEECDDDCGYIKKVFHAIGRFLMFKMYYPVENFCRRNKERLSRSWDYARFGWLNYDWDMAYAWDLFEFKLKRLYKCLEDGHAIQEPEDMKALRELTKLVRRLGKHDNYSRKYCRQHDKKWGKLESRCDKPSSHDKNGKVISYLWESWRKNCPLDAPKKIKEQERKEFRKCWGMGEKDRVRDIKRMGEIIRVHGLKFWD